MSSVVVKSSVLHVILETVRSTINERYDKSILDALEAYRKREEWYKSLSWFDRTFLFNLESKDFYMADRLYWSGTRRDRAIDKLCRIESLLKTNPEEVTLSSEDCSFIWGNLNDE